MSKVLEGTKGLAHALSYQEHTLQQTTGFPFAMQRVAKAERAGVRIQQQRLHGFCVALRAGHVQICTLTGAAVFCS